MNKGMLLCVLLILGIISCKPSNNDETPAIPEGVSRYTLDDQTVVANQTTLYQTDEGQIIQIIGADFEIDLILSDFASSSFTLASGLDATDNGKATAVLREGSQLYFSQSGEVNFSNEDSTGTFNIQFTNGTTLTDGEIFLTEIKMQAIEDFTGISQTDANGAPMSNPDANDWGVRTTWSLVETTVFQHELNSAVLPSATLSLFPNPFVEYCILQIDLPAGFKADVVLVNENFEVEKRFEALTPQQYSFLLDDPTFKGKYHRFYYKLYANNSTHYGSGDALLN